MMGIAKAPAQRSTGIRKHHARYQALQRHLYNILHHARTCLPRPRLREPDHVLAIQEMGHRLLLDRCGPLPSLHRHQA